jgi:hypothetical protein
MCEMEPAVLFQPRGDQIACPNIILAVIPDKPRSGADPESIVGPSLARIALHDGFRASASLRPE